jgi:hypothetical protein
MGKMNNHAVKVSTLAHNEKISEVIHRPNIARARSIRQCPPNLVMRLGLDGRVKQVAKDLACVWGGRQVDPF